MPLRRSDCDVRPPPEQASLVVERGDVRHGVQQVLWVEIPAGVTRFLRAGLTGF